MNLQPSLSSCHQPSTKATILFVHLAVLSSTTVSEEVCWGGVHDMMSQKIMLCVGGCSATS